MQAMVSNPTSLSMKFSDLTFEKILAIKVHVNCPFLAEVCNRRWKQNAKTGRVGVTICSTLVNKCFVPMTRNISRLALGLIQQFDMKTSMERVVSFRVSLFGHALEPSNARGTPTGNTEWQAMSVAHQPNHNS